LKKIIDNRPRQWHIILTYELWEDYTTTKSSTGHTPFQLLYDQEVIMPIELELTSLCLSLRAEEFNSTDISQRINALITLEEQRSHALDNLKRRQHTIKKYFNKKTKYVDFKIHEKVLLWDSSHVERGRHSRFHKLWLGPFKISSVLGTNSYLLKDMDERLFSYNTNGSHLKHYVEPN